MRVAFLVFNYSIRWFVDADPITARGIFEFKETVNYTLIATPSNEPKIEVLPHNTRQISELISRSNDGCMYWMSGRYWPTSA